jgi:ABC-type lipoprotein release transport system permease subunit
MYELFIGMRYLRAKHRHGFISLISFISVAGITVGVIALIVVLSVYAGFTGGLRDQILGINSHIIVQRTEGYITDYNAMRENILAVDGVIGATPYLYTQTLLSGSGGGSGVVLRGYRSGHRGATSSTWNRNCLWARWTHWHQPKMNRCRVLSWADSSPLICVPAPARNCVC